MPSILERSLQRIAGIRVLTLLAIATAVRVAWIVVCPNEPIGDQVIYHDGALSLLRGTGFAYADGSPIGFWPIGYSLALAGVYALAGPSYLGAFVFNAVLGVVTVWATYWLGKQLYGERTGKLAALGMALYPGLVMYVTVIGSENLYIPLSMLAIALAVRAQRAPGGVRAAVLCGVTAGVATLVRPNSAVFPLIIACAAWLLARDLRAGLKQALIVGVVLVAIATPYGLHNKRVFGEFSITPFNGGVLLMFGNHEGAVGLNPADGNIERLGGFGTGLPLPEHDRRSRKRAIEFILGHPLAFAELVGLRAYHTLKAETVGVGWNLVGVERAFGQGSLLAFKLIATAGWYTVLLLCLLALAYRLGRRELGRAELLLLFAVGVSSLPFLIVLGMDRYHLPLVPLLIVLGATRLMPTLETRPAAP